MHMKMKTFRRKHIFLRNLNCKLPHQRIDGFLLKLDLLDSGEIEMKHFN